MAGNATADTDDSIVGINVTPLVDITLVLLIIFMVTAKWIVNQTINMELPRATQAATADKVMLLSIELAANGKIVVDKIDYGTDDEVVSRLAQDAFKKNPEARAVIRADKEVTHGRVIHIIDLLKRAGVNKIAFGVVRVPGPGTPALAPAPK